jgi:hypothetical protein
VTTTISDCIATRIVVVGGTLRVRAIEGRSIDLVNVPLTTQDTAAICFLVTTKCVALILAEASSKWSFVLMLCDVQGRTRVHRAIDHWIATNVRVNQSTNGASAIDNMGVDLREVIANDEILHKHPRVNVDVIRSKFTFLFFFFTKRWK